ncbi:MAG: hypothetical protein K6E91_14675 [Butyrivibrio sp.]|nr:hypothetical protein [Butyrivibrio sp.]
MRNAVEYLIKTIMYEQTGNDLIDEAIFYSSLVLEGVAVIAIILLIVMNKPLREHRTPDKKLIFSECILIICQNVIQMLLVPLIMINRLWAIHTFNILLTLTEPLYMLNILQWVVCVDFCLYHSEDHLRRQYRHFAIPIVIVTALQLIHNMLIYYGVGPELLWGQSVNFAQMAKLAVEIGYILYAVYIVREYKKTSREPSFISLEAFIIPFVLGSLVRYYDAPLMALGIILTYVVISRRDKYLDMETGFFNREFLNYRSSYRDHNNYTGGSGILIDAAGHGKSMAAILKEFKPVGANVFVLGKDLFLIMSEALRGSALKMAAATIREAAETADEPYSPGISTASRGKEESAVQFARRLTAGNM